MRDRTRLSSATWAVSHELRATGRRMDGRWSDNKIELRRAGRLYACVDVGCCRELVVYDVEC